MKRTFLLIALLIVISCVPKKVKLNNEFAVAKGGKLEIDLKTGGSIKIEGWDKDSAMVDVKFINCDADDYQFDIYKTDSGIRLKSDFRRKVHSSNIRVLINIPKEFNIELRSSGGGVNICSVTGEFEGSIGGGGFDLRNLTGKVNLSTGGGSVSIKDSKLDGTVSTGGGSVLVENVEGDIKAASGGGNVVYKNVKTPDRAFPSDAVYIWNAGGTIDVPAAPAGADVSTGGGKIIIGSAAEYVVARSGGGDIKIDSIDGWVTATTGAGDIKVTMIGDPKEKKRDVSLSTGLGEVTLTVPEGLSMEVDVVLAYTKDSSRKYKIDSDFRLQQTETDKWDYKHGTGCKYIYGKATIKDGKNKIKIKTTNGDVRLKYGK